MNCRNGQLDEYEKALQLVQQRGRVTKAMQIGFHLSARVLDEDYRMNMVEYEVSFQARIQKVNKLHFSGLSYLRQM